MDKQYVKITFIVLSILLAFNAQISAQNRDPSTELEGFSEFILQQMEEWKAPGCAVAIVREGKVI